MKRALVLILLLLAVPLHAQYAVDTTQVVTPAKAKKSSLGGGIASFLTLHTGILIHYAGHESLDLYVRDKVQSWRGEAPACKVDDYIRYLPVAADLGLSFLGAPARNGFVDRSVELGVASVACIVLTRGTKHLMPTQRPNGGDFKSFPSGHTSVAFMGAELVRMEYGPLYGAGAYAVATMVGALRIYNNRHWLSDVLAGAGVGIFSAHVGGWLMQPTKKLFGIKDSDWGKGGKPNHSQVVAQFAPVVDPVSGCLCAGLALSF